MEVIEQTQFNAGHLVKWASHNTSIFNDLMGKQQLLTGHRSNYPLCFAVLLAEELALHASFVKICIPLRWSSGVITEIFSESKLRLLTWQEGEDIWQSGVALMQEVMEGI